MASGGVSLDEIDERLLTLLRDDARQTIAQLAKELGISAKRLNDFLHSCRVQYRPNGSNTWQLYTDYAKDHIAVTQLVRLNNGYDMPMLLWTPKGRDFIFDLAEREMPTWYA